MKSKGVFEMTETFLKMVTAAYLAIMLLGIFFAINSYYLYFQESEINRDVLALADGMMSADCLAVYDRGYAVKALLDEKKLEDEVLSQESCIKFGKNFKYDIILSKTGSILYKLGDRGVGGEDVRSSLFPAAMMKATGEVVAVTMNVTVEQ